MDLKEFGQKAAKVATIALDPQIKRLHSQRMLGEAHNYYSKEAEEYGGIPAALTDIVLLHSQEASEAWQKAVKALFLPGCQSLLGQASVHAPSTRMWIDKVFQAKERGEVIPGIPAQCTGKEYSDNTDWLFFIDCLREFVRVGFNREIDKVNKKCKVSLDPEKTPALYGFLIQRAVLENCGVKIQDWNKYRPDYMDGMMTSNPNPRAQRLAKKQIIAIYKRYKFTLKHDKKLLFDADQWYQCRVVFPGPEEYCRTQYKKTDIFVDPKNVDKAIKPFDLVTNYKGRRRIIF